MNRDGIERKPDRHVAPVVEITASNSPADRALRSLSNEDARPREGGSDTDADLLVERLRLAIPQPRPALRILIALLGLVQLTLAIPWLIDTDPFGLLSKSEGTHVVRDGAIGTVIGVAALMTAWRPRWAIPCFILAAMPLLAQVIAGLTDNSIAASGTIELIHVLSVLLTCLIGMSAIRLSDLTARSKT